MMTDCCNRFRSYLAPVSPEKEPEQWDRAGRTFEFGTVVYGAGAAFYSGSLFLSGGKWEFLLSYMAYFFKAASGGCFLKSAWDARKIEMVEAQGLAIKAVVLVASIIFSEIFIDGLTTYDHPVRKYGQVALGILLNVVILTPACIIAKRRSEDLNSDHNPDHEPIPDNESIQ